MSTPAPAAPTASADNLLERAVIVQMLEDGSFAPDYFKLADQLGLSREAAKKRWSRYTIKLRKDAEEAGKPITMPEKKLKQSYNTTPKKAKATDTKAEKEVDETGGASPEKKPGAAKSNTPKKPVAKKTATKRKAAETNAGEDGVEDSGDAKKAKLEFGGDSDTEEET